MVVASYGPLYFCSIGYNVLSSVSRFICIPSPTHESRQRSVLSGQQTSSQFHSVVSLVPVSFISALTFVISFFLLTLGFGFLFLVLWGREFGCLRFLCVSWGQHLSFVLCAAVAVSHKFCLCCVSVCICVRGFFYFSFEFFVDPLVVQ